MISFKGTYASSFRDRKVKGKIAPKKRKIPKKCTIYVRAKPSTAQGPKQQAIVQIGQHYYRAALGRAGITAFKREGDGATPLAEMRCLFGFWRKARGRRPNAPLPFLEAKPDHGWCDAPSNANYNGPVPMPFKASHETLQREDQLYDCGVVLDWNIAPITGGRQRARGSAIFLHVAKEGYTPTEGCIALYPKDLAHLIRQLTPQTYFKVL